MFSLIWILAGLAILPMVFNGDEPSGDQTDGEDNGSDPEDGVIRGTTENDLIDGGDHGTNINAYPEVWNLDDSFGNDTLYGGGADDSIQATSGDDLIVGEGGADSLSGWVGNDTINAGWGNDSVDGFDGDNLVYGGNGDDWIMTRGGEDTVYAGAGDDGIYDLGGAGIVNGGAGNDTISFYDGAIVSGGSGADALYLTATMTGETAGQTPATISDFDPAQDRLQVALTLGLPTPVAGDQAPVLGLVDWADGTGADLMYGDQTIVRIAGGQDLDPADLDVVVTLYSSNNAVFTDGDLDARIEAGKGKDVIFGGGGDDVINVGPSDSIEGVDEAGDLADGGAGNDTLIGRGGDAYLDGYDGESSLWTEFNLHEDTLLGGAGSDVLRAINGSQMTGGAGADQFEVIYDDQDVPDGSAYLPARITDFDPAVDTIAVSTPDADGAALSVVAWADGLGADVLLGNTVVAAVTGGQGLTVADLVVTA